MLARGEIVDLKTAVGLRSGLRPVLRPADTTGLSGPASTATATAGARDAAASPPSCLAAERDAGSSASSSTSSIVLTR